MSVADNFRLPTSRSAVDNTANFAINQINGNKYRVPRFGFQMWFKISPCYSDGDAILEIESL